jgi:hypothetical protein
MELRYIKKYGSIVVFIALSCMSAVFVIGSQSSNDIPLIERGAAAIFKILGSAQPAVTQNPYKNQVAQVRVGNNLCTDETQAAQARLNHVQSALQKNLGVSLAGKKTPKISILCSGGGYCAMISMMGFVNGFEKSGILDYVTYMAAVSGGTWFVGNYMDAKVRNAAVTVQQFKDAFIPRIANQSPFNLSPTERKQAMQMIMNALMVEYSFGRPVTLVDLYGSLLANRFFPGTDREMRYASMQAPVVKSGATPIPIYTTVRGENLTRAQEQWYELTPFEFGGSWVGQYIPTWALGRLFKNGVSQDYGVERNLGLELGACGSAFALSLNEELLQIVGNINTGSKLIDDFLKTELTKVINSPDVVDSPAGTRFTCAKNFNYTAGMAASSISTLPQIKRVDSGKAFNLPYPVVSGDRPGRLADILIFLDASPIVAGAPQLKAAQAYAQANNLPFPTINYEGIELNAISIFKEAGKPTVIYMPRTNDTKLLPLLSQPAYASYAQYVQGFDVNTCAQKGGYCLMTNFVYTADQIAQLSALTEFNAMTAKAQIEGVIREVIAAQN